MMLGSPLEIEARHELRPWTVPSRSINQVLPLFAPETRTKHKLSERNILLTVSSNCCGRPVQFAAQIEAAYTGLLRIIATVVGGLSGLSTREINKALVELRGRRDEFLQLFPARALSHY